MATVLLRKHDRLLESIRESSKRMWNLLIDRPHISKLRIDLYDIYDGSLLVELLGSACLPVYFDD